MAAKITVTGELKELRTVSSPDGVNWYCLEITTGGSPNAPKGLPTPSSDIQFTILLNDKQLKKLRDESKSAQVQLIGSKLLIQGELILDLSYEVVNGDLGVICFQAENLDAKKKLQELDTVETIQPEKEPASEPPVPTTPKEHPFKNPMELESILIPKKYKESQPREEKILAAIEYYQQNGSFDTAIQLEKKPQGWFLKDGYTRYLAAQKLQLSEIAVALYEGEDDGEERAV